MTATQNVATYARVRPYNPAINEDKRLTARCSDGNKILNQNGENEDTYNFTRVFDMGDDTEQVFRESVQPLLDYKILQGINSIFIVYGQSGSGKSFTLIGEGNEHMGILPMSLQYLLNKPDIVEDIHISSIEAYGIKSTKIGFYDLVDQLDIFNKQSNKNAFDAYKSQDNRRLDLSNAKQVQITHDNVHSIISNLQYVSHMAPTLKNPHSSRGHTVYFVRVKIFELEPVYFVAVDLAGSEGQTALGTKDEFITGLKLAISKGKILNLNKKQLEKSFEEMYKIRSLEAGCINNGLTQLQSIFGELIKKKISQAQGLGLRKVLSQFISLNSAYAILFTLSASANNNKVTKATLNFAKQTQLVKVDTKKAKKKIDKDKIIRQLNELIEELRKEMTEKNEIIENLQEQLEIEKQKNENFEMNEINENFETSGASAQRKDSAMSGMSGKSVIGGKHPTHRSQMSQVFVKFDELHKEITEAAEEEKQWNVRMRTETITKDNVASGGTGGITEAEMRMVFNKFDSDNSGSIDEHELHAALKSMGQELTKEQIADLIVEIDVNGDGEIDFDEFKVMFGQSRFINMHQNELIRNMTRMMTTITNMDPGFLKELENEYQEQENDSENENDENQEDQGSDIEYEFKFNQDLNNDGTRMANNNNNSVIFKDSNENENENEYNNENMNDNYDDSNEKDELIERLQNEIRELQSQLALRQTETAGNVEASESNSHNMHSGHSEEIERMMREQDLARKERENIMENMENMRNKEIDGMNDSNNDAFFNEVDRVAMEAMERKLERLESENKNLVLKVNSLEKDIKNMTESKFDLINNTSKAMQEYKRIVKEYNRLVNDL